MAVVPQQENLLQVCVLMYPKQLFMGSVIRSSAVQNTVPVRGIWDQHWQPGEEIADRKAYPDPEYMPMSEK